MPRLLLGHKYAPLRKEFQQLEEFIIKDRCSNVFVSTGGADPIHLAFSLISYIIDNNIFEFTFHFVIGIVNIDKGKITEISKNHKNIILHYNVENMSELMRNCAVAITAAGSTIYELCACAIPTITYVLADNQMSGAKAFYELDIVKFCGDAREEKNFSSKIVKELYLLDKNVNVRKSMSKNMKKLVDGNGAINVTRCLFD